MSFWQWSKVAGSNGTIDATINATEGMPPAQNNDSQRAVMARLAEYRDDTSGLLLTAGTSTAYTVSTNQGIPATPNDGQLLVVSFHTINGAAATLQVDGGLVFPLQISPGNAVGTALINANVPIPLKFKTSSSSWILLGSGVAALAQSVQAGSVTNAALANMAAWTLKGNNTSGSAAPGDFTIDALTVKASPLAADEVPIWDAAGAAMKKATLSSLVSAFPLRGYLAGLTLSGGGSQTLSVAAGVATSDDATTFMTIGAFTKTFASWVVGSGNGGLDTGSIANNTWYHAFVIERPDTGVVDILISTSATAPTLPTNYTKQRRIGSIKTDAGPNIIPFFQNADTFLWSTMPALDVANASLSSSAASVTVQTPPGVRTEGIFHAMMFPTTSAPGVVEAWLLSSLDIADTAPTNSGYSGVSPLATIMTGNSNNSLIEVGAQARIWTNTSAQIRHRGTATDAGAKTSLQTIGWVDPRGKFT